MGCERELVLGMVRFSGSNHSWWGRWRQRCVREVAGGRAEQGCVPPSRAMAEPFHTFSLHDTTRKTPNQTPLQPCTHYKSSQNGWSKTIDCFKSREDSANRCAGLISHLQASLPMRDPLERTQLTVDGSTLLRRNFTMLGTVFFSAFALQLYVVTEH